MGDILPTLVCPERANAALEAEPTAVFWAGIESVALSETVSGLRPVQSTGLRVARTAEALRILFEVEDTHVQATLTERDALLYTEEVVEVFLDPVGDLQCYFEIELNPLNAILDLVLRRARSGFKKDFSWRCEDLQTLVKMHSNGWNAELEIPFGSLVADRPSAGTAWRANFCRIDRPLAHERELSAWSPTFRPSFHTPERFGVLEFR